MPEHDDSIADPFQLRGTTIEGKYRVASVVGDGGFGVVYRGVHAGFGEPIAIKCLKLPHALDDKQREGFLEQLRDEGRLLHRLSKATPGIVQALDVGAVTTAAGSWVPYLVLEWLDGDTLADHFGKRLTSGGGPFPIVEAIRLIEPAARALAVAHAMKVAHRDVKPHNLFVTKVAGASTVKVLDFGIAKVLTDYPTFRDALAATKATPTAFTPRYGAPEQFNKARGPSGPWTDVFALGLILVELMTGHKALEGDDPTQLYIAAADPALRPTPQARGVTVPDALEQVIAKALAVEPKDRYADAGELIDALLAAAGLAPASPSAALGTSSQPRTVALGAAKTEAEPPTVAEARGRAVIAMGPPSGPNDPTEVAPGNTRNAARTSRSPGAGPKPAADPMSETPFFERHHLPVSTAHDGGRPSDPKGDTRPADAEAPGRRPMLRLALLAALAGGAAAVYAAWSPLDVGKGPKGVSSGIVLKTPLLPHPHSAAPVASSAPVVPASVSPPVATASTTDMVLVAAGSVGVGDGGAGALHDFYLDRTEVTVRAYQACVAKRMCSPASRVSLPPGAGERWSPATGADGADAASAQLDEYLETWSRRCTAPRGAEDHPVNCVDYAGAEAYCHWVGKRLPTEPEWDLAARGAERREYPWGAEAPTCGRACYDKNGGCRDPSASVATCAAGVFPADRTPEGIYDLGGNVAEWTATAESAGGAAMRVARGGSFIDAVEATRATTRAVVPPALAHVGIGFRCALDAPAKP
jgi:serine/threonine-protein kinase